MYKEIDMVEKRRIIIKVTQGEKRLEGITVTLLMNDSSIFFGGVTNSEGLAIMNVLEDDIRWSIGGRYGILVLDKNNIY